MEFYTTQAPNFKQWQKINADLKLHLKMGSHGWAGLFFDYQGKFYNIALSDVFDPFQDLVHWVDDIAKDRLPATLEIDEEGHSAELCATLIENDNISFSVKSVNYDKQYFAIIINRQALVRAFQIEIKRFFSQEFDPLHWDKAGIDEKDIAFRQDGLKEWVLNHTWK